LFPSLSISPLSIFTALVPATADFLFRYWSALRHRASVKYPGESPVASSTCSIDEEKSLMTRIMPVFTRVFVESLPRQDIIYQYAYRSRFDEGTPCGMSKTALFREPFNVVITPCNLGTSAGCPFIRGTTVQICIKQIK